MELYNADCLEKMKDFSDNSIDIVIADLPYKRFSHLKWDIPIDLNKMWREINRISKPTTPIFLFGDMAFGVQLVNSNPKNFKYEIVWYKNRTTTPLLSRRRLGKATEYIFIFYKKQCCYNYAKYHKIINKNGEKYTNIIHPLVMGSKVQMKHCKTKVYSPLLPTNVVWNGPLETGKNYSSLKNIKNEYNPKLPTNVINYGDILTDQQREKARLGAKKNDRYTPKLPVNFLSCDSVRRGKIIKNITEKPQFLLEFLLKYFSNPNDVCLDFCMGSGSCGVACNKLERKFIGIEINKDHFDKAEKRLDNL